jgi:hypothetical protein
MVGMDSDTDALMTALGVVDELARRKGERNLPQVHFTTTYNNFFSKLKSTS